jgi:hypothetical protein
MPRPARKRQLEIAGAEVPVIPELEEVIAPYCEMLYEWRELGERIAMLKPQVVERMRSMGQSLYVYRDGDQTYRMVLEDKFKLSCKREREPDGDMDAEPVGAADVF